MIFNIVSIVLFYISIFIFVIVLSMILQNDFFCTYSPK